MSYIEVTATPHGGEPRTLRFPDTERGTELAAYVKSLARREEIDSADVQSVEVDAAKPAKKSAAKPAPAASNDQE